MELKQRLTTSQKVENALTEQGRKKSWLAAQMGVTPMTVSNKLRDNTWRVGEIMLLQALLGID